MTGVTYAVDSQVAVVTLANAAGGNLLNAESLELLQAALTRADAEEEVRVIVLRADGDPFCWGMDLDVLQAEHRNQELLEKTIARYTGVLSGIYNASKPVIALVQGAVKAGGIGLVGICDIVLASERATFEFSEVILGLIPANVMPFLQALRLPAQKLKYLILTAKNISAQEALRLDLVDEVFPEGRLAAGVKAVIKSLFRASPRALAETKHFARRLARENLEQGTVLAREKLRELIGNPAILQAIQNFQAGTTPPWFARYQPREPLVREEEP